MYLVIAYHGKGNGEVESDLRVLWGNLEQLAKIRRIEHVFCFQGIRENIGADLLMVVEYRDTAELCGTYSEKKDVNAELTQNLNVKNIKNNRVDYWFYIRNSGDLK